MQPASAATEMTKTATATATATATLAALLLSATEICIYLQVEFPFSLHTVCLFI